MSKFSLLPEQNHSLAKVSNDSCNSDLFSVFSQLPLSTVPSSCSIYRNSVKYGKSILVF